jgi:hypothetical protein
MWDELCFAIYHREPPISRKSLHERGGREQLRSHEAIEIGCGLTSGDSFEVRRIPMFVDRTEPQRVVELPRVVKDEARLALPCHYFFGLSDVEVVVQPPGSGSE